MVEQQVGGEGRRRRRGGKGEQPVVPDMQFSSYYGRPIVKPAPWKEEIPVYLFVGGLAAGSGMIAAGARLSGLDDLRRRSQYAALGALGTSVVVLVKDLGRPERFLNMMRTVKLTSPMSVGTWILSLYGGFTGLASATELIARKLPEGSRIRWGVEVVDGLASLASGAFGPPLASYTAVLLSNTATPTWHASYKHLPFVFTGSALAASGGMAMVTTPTRQTTPARRVAILGSTMELAAFTLLEKQIGIAGEPLHHGQAGKFLKASKVATVLGVLGAATVARRSRAAAVVSGAALLAGSALTRFGVFDAGMESAKDPKYVVEPQKEHLAKLNEERERGIRSGITGGTPRP